MPTQPTVRIAAIVITVVTLMVFGVPSRATAQGPPPAAPEADVPAPPREPQGSSPQHDDHQQGDPTEYPSLRIVGFGSVSFNATDRPEGPRGFNLGQFVLHMASSLSTRVTFFGELSFTARSDAGTGSPPATGFNVEVERLILRFDQSDQLKVSFGRYHTPINWWNTAYHHGAWLQTTINRPEMIQFGGQFLPVHFVGGLMEGSVPASGWNINYKAGYGNGRATVISRAGDAGDSSGERAWLASVFAKPDRAFGLELGTSMYGDTVTLANGRKFDEQIIATHGVWQREDPEIIAEYAAVRHKETGTTLTDWSHAYYVQAAYRLYGKAKLWKPYYRFEHIGIPTTDAMFQSVPRLDGSTVGIRYDLTPFAAAKGEYRYWRRGPGTSSNYGMFLQISFTF